MARLFNDATPDFLTSSSVPSLSYPFTISLLFKTDVLTITQSMISLALDNNNRFNIYIDSSGDLRANMRYAAGNALNNVGAVSSDTWHQATWVCASSLSRTLVLDGTSSEHTASKLLPAVTQMAIGCRDKTGSSTFDWEFSGDIAEAAIHNVALDQAEIDALIAGYSPKLIRPGSLVFYVPLVRDNDRDIVGGLSFTENGTPGVSNHPRIIYPSAQILQFPPVAAVGGVTGKSNPLYGPLGGPLVGVLG